MKCICVIILSYVLVSVTGLPQISKDIEPPPGKNIANPPIQSLLSQNKTIKARPPFKPDSSQLRLSGTPPTLRVPPPVQQTETPAGTKVTFTSSTVSPTPHMINVSSGPEIKNPTPTNSLVTTPTISQTTRPPVTTSTPTTASSLVTTPTISQTMRPPVTTKTPTTANRLVTTSTISQALKPPVTSTTLTPAESLVTSTKIPYWTAKPTKPPSKSPGPLILIPKPTTPRPNDKVLLQKPYDPCAPFKRPPTPDFRAPGRRISEVKCFDYIWDLRVRNDEAEHQTECANWRLRGGITNYIIGGHYTFAGDYPNMGAIGWKEVVGTWRFMCGCTLISTKFILTAAHCSSASDRDTSLADVVPKIVRLGDKNIQDVTHGNYDATIIRIINHPKYKSPKKYFDIALMELGQKQKFNRDIQPACLWTKDSITKYGEHAQVTGWGVVESGTLKTSPELMAATVDIIDFDKCNRLLRLSCNRNWCGLQPDQLCAGKEGGGVDACQGDSGGPLQVKIPLPVGSQGTMHYVLGVTSFGIGCALPGLPGVYTKVSRFIDWIESVVWPGQNATVPVTTDRPVLKRNKRSLRSQVELDDILFIGKDFI